MSDEPTDDDLKEALENVRCMLDLDPNSKVVGVALYGKVGSADCPSCGGPARLWFGIDQRDGALSVCCIEYDDCGFAYQWPRGEW